MCSNSHPKKTRRFRPATAAGEIIAIACADPLQGPAVRLGCITKGRRRGQRLSFIGRYRVENEGDVASPAPAGRIHRRQHAVEHPDQARQVIGDQVGTDAAGLLASAGKVVERFIQRDRDIGGQRPGPVRGGLPAGNWDTEFVDNPETFDVDRNTRGHLGFGYGVHQCIGQNLARVEMQVAFATLARRLPGLKLAVSPDALSFKESDIYGMKELPSAGDVKSK